MEFTPQISNSTAGPLGIVHLPRFWFKMRAHAAGVLPDGYRHGTGGFDGALLDTFGIDGAAFEAYIAREAPGYQACESWIRANARNLSPEAIETFNEATVTLQMPDPRRSDWTARFGIGDTGYDRAIGLNQLDDWDALHNALLDSTAEDGPVVPAISSSIRGPLGIPHLPRLWFKHRLHGAGRLADGYRHGSGGFDELLTTAIGLDREAFAAYVESEQPGYLDAEAWVRANATTLTDETVAAVTTRMLNANLPDVQLPARHAELGIADPSFTRGIALNDLDDWAGLHRQLLAVR
jgi:hypothetical protein